MADINMSVDAATNMIVETQAELLKCMEAMEVELGLMEHLQKTMESAQVQYDKAKSDLVLLKVQKTYLKSKIDIVKNIRDFKSKLPFAT
jgi:hypothetical protein